MKKIILTLIFSALLFGSTRGDVKIIEAAENIQYLSQKIAVDYLLLYNKQGDHFLKKRIEKNIKRLESFANEISEMTKSNSAKAYITYFKQDLDAIKQIINQEKSIENVNQILNYGEEFLEVSDTIIDEHKYNYTKEEKMLMSSKKAQYLFEYVTSYYMASKIGIKNDFNREKMRQAIVQVDEILREVSEYNYSIKLKKSVEQICTIWSISKGFYDNEGGAYIPHILLHSTQYSQGILEELERYHKKNL